MGVTRMHDENLQLLLINKAMKHVLSQSEVHMI